jgi:hypothetical protein
LAALNRKIELSLKPIDQSEDKPGEQQENTQKVTSIPQEKKAQTGKENALQDIHDLLSGKLKPSDIIPLSDRLRESGEAMGDHLIIGSIPKHENQSKGFKL